MKARCNFHLEPTDRFRVFGATSPTAGFVQWLDVGDAASVFMTDQRLAELRDVIDKHLSEAGFGIAQAEAAQ